MAGMVRGERRKTEDGRRKDETQSCRVVESYAAIQLNSTPRFSFEHLSDQPRWCGRNGRTLAVTRSTAAGATTARKPRPRLKVERIS